MEPLKENYNKLINEAYVVYLNNQDMAAALKELIKNTTEVSGSNKKILVKQLTDREEQGSTIIAPKVALAHTETDLINNLILSFGFSKDGYINWSLEGKEQVKVIIMLLFPINSDRSYYIEIIKYLMFKLANEEHMDKIINLTNAQDISKILTEKKSRRNLK